MWVNFALGGKNVFDSYTMPLVYNLESEHFTLLCCFYLAESDLSEQCVYCDIEANDCITILWRILAVERPQGLLVTSVFPIVTFHLGKWNLLTLFCDRECTFLLLQQNAGTSLTHQEKSHLPKQTAYTVSHTEGCVRLAHCRSCCQTGLLTFCLPVLIFYLLFFFFFFYGNEIIKLHSIFRTTWWQ